MRARVDDVAGLEDLGHDHEEPGGDLVDRTEVEGREFIVDLGGTRRPRRAGIRPPVGELLPWRER